MNRRQFLRLAAASPLLSGCAAPPLPALPPWLPVSVLRPGMAEGHWLRDLRQLPPSSGTRKTGTVIIGSGIAGLTAAWRLIRAGHTDFTLLAGPEPDGNASAGRWQDVAYPRGAHYLPLPTAESTHVRELLYAFGICEADPFTARPRYDERVLLHALDERLRVGERWQEGLTPHTGLTTGALAEQERFFALMHQLRGQRGSDGKPLFAIPVVLSSMDPAWRALDAQTFAHWLDANAFTHPALRWYLDYCCRDDYGLNSERISAWAGLHYFASRSGEAVNADTSAVLTWPEGLYHLAHRLGQASQAQRVTGFALAIREQRAGVQVDYADRAGGRIVTLQADRVICATPLHVATRLLPHIQEYGFNPRTDMPSHAPWLVANLYLDRFPREPDLALAWDNVVYGSRSLGYTVATHQLIRAAKPRYTVFTAYHALAERGPDDSRHWLHGASEADLVALALNDLATVYGFDLWRCARGLELTVRGHAMASPTPGYLANRGLQALRAVDGRVLFAHSDLSGYSIFEEAAWWGWQAAVRILAG